MNSVFIKCSIKGWIQDFPDGVAATQAIVFSKIAWKWKRIELSSASYFCPCMKGFFVETLNNFKFLTFDKFEQVCSGHTPPPLAPVHEQIRLNGQWPLTLTQSHCQPVVFFQAIIVKISVFRLACNQFQFSKKFENWSTFFKIKWRYSTTRTNEYLIL